MAATWAARNGRFDIAGQDAALGQTYSSGVKAIVVFIAALPAAQAKMSPFEGVGHTAGRNPEGLHYKFHEDESEYKSGYQAFKGICNFGRSAFLRSLFGAVLFGLA